jgi:hypothetical protein
VVVVDYYSGVFCAKENAVGVTQLKVKLLIFMEARLYSAQTNFNKIKHLEIQPRNSYIVWLAYSLITSPGVAQ